MGVKKWKMHYIPKYHDAIMSKSLLAIIAVIVVGAVSVAAISPYFIESTVDEALPTGAIIQPKMEDKDVMMIKDDATMMEDKMMEGAVIDEESMVEERKMLEEDTMMEEDKKVKAMMEEESMMEETMMEDKEMMMEETMEVVPMSYAGTFIGVGDGIHDAQGDAYTIPLEDGSNVLRLENFQSTNGPDLFVYLATDDNASEFINLGDLKANKGNQNYEIPDDVDLEKYNKVLIWCKSFGVLFGSAELSS